MLRFFLSGVCSRLDIDYFSCRGYVSQSEMWGAAQRLIQLNSDKAPVIVHLGDHNPSGIDMSRDIVDRMQLFGVDPIFERIALDMNQIEQYNPPPNPAKITDSRANGYIQKHGNSSWKLDALKPEVIANLIESTVMKYCDQALLEEVAERERKDKEILMNVSNNWTNIEQSYRNNEQ